jgi:REP element-mobilizing transposase RayT
MADRFYQKHIRLREFDYSSSNSFFITICTKNHQIFFGEIRNGIMGYSEIGNTAALFLEQIPINRPNVNLGEHIVMPNHIHCILEITGQEKILPGLNKYAKPLPGSVSVIINQYKGAVKKWSDRNGFNEFQWQPRFFDNVIRNHQQYLNIENYIRTNPSSWKNDKFKM